MQGIPSCLPFSLRERLRVCVPGCACVCAFELCVHACLCVDGFSWCSLLEVCACVSKQTGFTVSLFLFGVRVPDGCSLWLSWYESKQVCVFGCVTVGVFVGVCRSVCLCVCVCVCLCVRERHEEIEREKEGLILFLPLSLFLSSLSAFVLSPSSHPFISGGL